METNGIQRDRREPDAEILLLPDNVSLRGPNDRTILRTLQENSVLIRSSCGGVGTCGECRIRFADHAPEPTASDLQSLNGEQISNGWRLACQHVVSNRMSIEIRPETGELNFKEQDDEYAESGDPNPSISLCTVHLDPADRRSWAARLGDALGRDVRIPSSVLERLSDPAIARSGRVSVITAYEDVLEVCHELKNTVFGLAIDVGTTTLAVYLFDLLTGQQLGVSAARNPQRNFGADVISRIAHVRREKNNGLSDLHDAVTEGLNELVARLTVQSSISSESIYCATVVGNPTMLHLLLSVDPTGIDVNPYVPKFTDSVRTQAGIVGLEVNANAIIETLPSVSAYVGADIVAGIIAAGLHKSKDRALFLDVGTNGEIVLAINGRLIACSTAAGPAFEGASLVQGMPALHGAIESVRIRKGKIHLEVVGDCIATGICGTGLLSAVAECLRHGLIDQSGRICGDGSALSNRIEGQGKTRRIRLTDMAPPVYLHQSDVRKFQLAKAAIRTGIERLLQHAELSSLDLDRILVGGAFSARLSSDHLIETGFLPAVDPRKIRIVGNTAGQGARQVLLHHDLMKEANNIAKRVEYLELSGDARFTEQYIHYMPFPAVADD